MPAVKSGLAALAVACLVVAYPAVAQNRDQLVERYTSLAGSRSNAEALVTGLRDGADIRLSSGNQTVNIDPPTSKMGYGNVDNALALTEASLQQQGITRPSAEQLKTSLTSVLGMRAEGRGWGEIANSMGFRLGELKRSERADTVTPHREHARAERPQRVEKPERPMRPERPERAGK